MQKPSSPYRMSVFLAAGLLLLSAPDSARLADAAPEGASYDRQVTLAYSVNNLGYTDTCG